MPSKIGGMLSAPNGALQVTEIDTDETASTMLEQLRTVEGGRFIEMPGTKRNGKQQKAASLRIRKVSLRLKEYHAIPFPRGEWKGLNQRVMNEGIQDEDTGNLRDVDDVERAVVLPVRPVVLRLLMWGEWLICWSGLPAFWRRQPSKRRRRRRTHISEAQKEELQ